MLLETSESSTTSEFDRDVPQFLIACQAAPQHLSFQGEHLSVDEQYFSNIKKKFMRCDYYYSQNFQIFKFNSNKSIFILHINIRFVVKSFYLLYEFVLQFPSPPDVIAETESMLEINNQLPKLSIEIPGYHFCHVPPNSKAFLNLSMHSAVITMIA